MATKKLKQKKARKGFLMQFKNLAILALMCYALIIFVSQQVQLSEKSQELQKINEKVEIAQQTSDEYMRLLNMTDEREYMERIAIERLGYAYPNERRFYDLSRN